MLSKTWGPIIGWIAIVWVVFIVILLMLPQYSPITRLNFNYAPIAVLSSSASPASGGSPAARKWFKGPKVQGTAEELAEIERDLNVI